MARELVRGRPEAERFELLGADREAHQRARAAVWEEKLRDGATALGVSLDRLPLAKSAPEKMILAALLKTATSVFEPVAHTTTPNGQGDECQPIRGAIPPRWRLTSDRFVATLSKVVA